MNVFKKSLSTFERNKTNISSHKGKGSVTGLHCKFYNIQGKWINGSTTTII